MAHGKSKDEPWHTADTLLPDETPVSLLRVAVSFAFLSEGQIIELDQEIIDHNLYDDIELVAAVGNGMGREGMFSQAIWFGEGGASWKWMKIDGIQFIVCHEDSVFRSGEPCVAVCTDVGLYYLTIPHPDYKDTWSRTLKTLWPTKRIDIKVWPLRGLRPFWWFEDYKDDWPFDKSEDKALQRTGFRG